VTVRLHLIQMLAELLDDLPQGVRVSLDDPARFPRSAAQFSPGADLQAEASCLNGRLEPSGTVDVNHRATNHPKCVRFALEYAKRRSPGMGPEAAAPLRPRKVGHGSKAAVRRSHSAGPIYP
jgi:hypothetical protein